MSEDYGFLQLDHNYPEDPQPPVDERVARLEELVGRLYETACAEQKRLIAEAMRA